MEQEKDLRKILSDNVKCLRAERGLTQANLAQLIGLSLHYVIDIENCRTWVSDKTLKSLAQAFCIPPYELLKPVSKQEETQENTINLDLIKSMLEIERKALISAVEASIDGIHSRLPQG
jgi:transcriptional regulator with XRE-family HTH domain